MEGRGAFTVYWYDFDPDGGLGRCCVTYLFLPGLIVSPWRPFSQAYRHHPRAPGATLNSIPSHPSCPLSTRRTDVIPAALLGDYQKLLSSAPSRRLNPSKVWTTRCVSS